MNGPLQIDGAYVKDQVRKGVRTYFAPVHFVVGLIASAIEARSDATPQSDAAEGESATRKGDAQ